MRPTILPPPSLLPYLSSSEVGWDGLLARAFHELPEVEAYKRPGDTNITLTLLTGGSMQWDMREIHARSSWDGVHLCPGDLILGAGTNVPYELRWRCTSPAPTYSFTLQLSRGLVARTVEELTDGDPSQLILVEQAGFQDPFLAQIALGLWRELQEGAPGGKLFAQCAAQLLIIHLLRYYTCSGNVANAVEKPAHHLTSQQLRWVRTYIRDHANQDLTLEVLARQIGFSPYHFARLFRETTGETPHHYVQRERLEYARRLLESNELSLAEVAVESGFGDQSYFTRVFKRALRMTPGAYRRERAS